MRSPSGSRSLPSTAAQRKAAMYVFGAPLDDLTCGDHPTAPLVAYLDEHLERRSDVWSCWKPLERSSDVWSRNLCERNFMRAEVDRGPLRLGLEKPRTSASSRTVSLISTCEQPASRTGVSSASFCVRLMALVRARVSSIIVPAIVPAVPVPVIVNPTCSGVNRRPPEGAPPVPTDYAPDNQADRPGDHQARAGTENRADVIRVRTSRTKGNHQNRRCSQ